MAQMLNQIMDNLLTYGARPEIPRYLPDNLNPEFGLRPYQLEAFERLICYFQNEQLRRKPAQLLFHMATGSGKTLIMAGAILWLYQQGYRNFLFFVNSTNIIEKTRDNFLNALSPKYLFADQLVFGDKKTLIREVDNFQSADGECINIAFTTIQALHIRLNAPRENAITFDDFASQKIVLISDEAHHINVDTKKGKLSVEEREERDSWETTVNRIFRASPENILLEFTATADLSDKDIAAKYADKIVFDYPLKQFRLDGYSKEVKVLQSDCAPLQRALQAVILSQYRRKVFEKYGKAVKPVLLFKSKKIQDSKDFLTEFSDMINNLDADVLDGMKQQTALSRCFRYFQDNGITPGNLVAELKNDFSPEKCIEVNSKEESQAKQLALNSLESRSNEYRAVFAVDKLNEGWDVLNLFDIVRMYDTRDSDTSTGRAGKTTIAEAQLIGRGARYCPFTISADQPKYQRKYDDDLENELRICEELYYHSASNPRYIHELHNALVETGICARRSIDVPVALKEEFRQSAFFRDGVIFRNQRVKFDRSVLVSLPNTVTQKRYCASIFTGATDTTTVFDGYKPAFSGKTQRTFRLADFGLPVLRKAMSRLEGFRFDNLQAFLPNVGSVSNFLRSPDYLGSIAVDIDGPEEVLANIPADERLRIATAVLLEVGERLQSESIEYQGTAEFRQQPLKDVFCDKILNIAASDSPDKELGVAQSQTLNASLRIDLSKKDWYAFTDNYGTSEEKYLVKFIDKTYDKLKEKYSDVYLLRNERHFKLYNFDDGKPVEPDFVLFLKEKSGDDTVYYQVFIEPKGAHLLLHDAWKESFLKSLKDRHRITVLWESRKYCVWGMPFYNEAMRKHEFEEAFDELV